MTLIHDARTHEHIKKNSWTEIAEVGRLRAEVFALPLLSVAAYIVSCETHLVLVIILGYFIICYITL